MIQDQQLTAPASLSEKHNTNEYWDQVISSEKSLLSFNFKEVWRYRDLLLMFVKRDVVTIYKQTILGPIWFFIQPIMTTLVFVIVFGRIAGLDTDGIPQILFYLNSIIVWNYFSDVLTITSRTFTDNASIFGKVYFPRLILPLSKIISGLLKFLIQFTIFFGVWIYYVGKGSVQPNLWALAFPLYILMMAGIGLGAGILITSMTTKYRDLTFLVTFGVQLLMYASPVIYPMSSISGKYQFFLWLNPLSSILEAFKYGFLGKGTLDIGWLLYSFAFMIALLFIGIVAFNKVERRFVDTV